MTKTLSSRIFDRNLGDTDSKIRENRKRIHMSKLAEAVETSCGGMSLNVHNQRRWSADSWIKAMIAMDMAYVDKEGKYIMIQSSLSKKELAELKKISSKSCWHDTEGEQ